MRGSRSIELARLKKEEEVKKKHFDMILAAFWFGTLRCSSAPQGVLVAMKHSNSKVDGMLL